MSRRDPLRLCVICRQRPVGWSKPRVDYCYSCLPGGPFHPPPCRGCGSSEDYFSGGLCGRCHLLAPQHYESCRDCEAWGVLRKQKWLCWRCRSWRQRFTRATCTSCQRGPLPIDEQGRCLLCERQTALEPAAAPTPGSGQQLFFANLPWPISWRRRPHSPGSFRPPARPTRIPLFELVHHRQLTLFDLPRTLILARARGALPEPQHPRMATVLDLAVLDHADRHGWPRSTVKRAREGMRVLQGLQDTPGAVLLATDAELLRQIALPTLNVIEVATAAGFMLDDREPAIRSWAAGLIADLPQQMRTELDAWFEVMANGSSSAPRRRPRSETTIRLHLRWAIPALTAWASAGHNSLREITPEHIRAALPPSGNPRSTMGAGLRSIFSVLKTRKLIFTNPIGRIRTGTHERRQPLPLETAVIRDALLSPNTARAALAALTAFHALRAGELRNARVTDAHDGRLQVGQRSIPLAEPARVRISAWLTYRDQCWPDTANPHLFLNHWNATRTDPVGQRWLGLTLGMPARVLREDRILHEIHTSGGDVRRVCDLFGLTVGAALRYLPNLLP